MSYQLVAQGTASNLDQLGNYQNRFEEGSRGYVGLELRSAVAADMIGWLAEKLAVVGVPASDVKTEGRFVRIYFKTEIAPLVLIAGAIALCIFIMGMILAWKLWKSRPATVLTWMIVAPILVIVGVILVIFLINKYGGKLIGPVKVEK